MSILASRANLQISASAPVGGALLTVAELELDFACCQLSACATDRDHGVHQCRKAIKRLTALVRLGAGVAREDARAIERILRDAGRVLAPTRDIAVVAKSLARLVDAEPSLGSLKGMAVQPLVEAIPEPLTVSRPVTEGSRGN